MTLITLDELARGALLITFGGAAGACTLAWPGSALWLVPAALGTAAGALTVPEIREEVARSWPALTDGTRQARAALADSAWQLPGVTRPARRPDVVGDDNGDGAAEGRTVRLEPRPARPERPAPRQGPRTLTPEQFGDDPLFRALDADPHRFIIGHTQGGKSTAMHAMAQAWAAQGQPVIVCDPDAARGQWPGCEVAGYAEDYRGIGLALERVRDAFDARSDLYADGQRDFAPMHLVIDEVHEVFDNVPGARELVLDTLGRRGAKRGIRVTIGTQDQNKDTLGLESAAVLSNFITAELARDERGRRVATVYRGNAAKRQHVKQYAVPPLPGAKSFIQPREAPAPAPAPRRAAVAADAPRPEVVSVRVPERPAASPEALLVALTAELPAEVRAQVPSISPERAGRLAAILEREGLIAQSVMKLERHDGDTYLINAPHAEAHAAPAPATRPRPRKPRDSAVTVRDRRRRLERIAYYQQAARDNVPFSRAYAQAPAGNKGNSNEMHAVYQAAKAVSRRPDAE